MSDALLGQVPEAGAEAPPIAAPVPSSEESVGAILAQARRSLGLSLEDVAHQLKFGVRQIEALEHGNFDRLHGATFARGMVRSYARLLKLDPDPLLERIAGRMAPPVPITASISFRRPIPFSDTARRTNFAYVVLTLVILAVGVVVALEWHQQRSARPARLALVPAAQAPLEASSSMASAAAPTVVAPATETAAAASSPTTAEASVSGPGPVTASGASPAAAPGPTPAAASAAEPVVAAPTPAAPATDGKPAAQPGMRRIVLSFDQEAWVQVKDASGKALLSQLNPAGTRKVVEGEAPFSLVIGNAQHVRVTYDEKPIDLAPHIKVEVARLTLD
ncbi:MAG TPA: helix-turn-helix domain-containing protein [Burkholderiales bacterium]|nr:helix-turn-helix domain-containing protein [Burkholderiales bacterium]